MWKFVTRGIRETLERRTCRTNVYSQTSQDSSTKNEVKTSLTCNYKFVAPSFSFFNKEFCGSTKTNGAKDKNHDSKWNTKYTWSEAIGWSGVLALGWVVCQTLCLRRRIFETEKKDTLKSKASPLPGAPISNLLNQVLNLGPKHILPIINCVGNNKIYAQESIEVEGKADKPFGPITIEEALQEATNEFANTHKLAMAEFEHHYGVRALEERRYKDAVKHFTTAANLSFASSMFNLGLCYELGLGTVVDYGKAAKYYSEAADRGHADAIYNLGVFHAQGRGGLVVDTDRARNYFIKAAKLGQSQAQHALDLEQRHQSKQKESDTIYVDEHKSILKYMQNNENMNHILKKLTNYSSASYTPSKVKLLDNSDPKRTTVAYKNSTQSVLDMFGLGESNVLSINVESNNCSVPC